MTEVQLIPLETSDREQFIRTIRKPSTMVLWRNSAAVMNILRMTGKSFHARRFPVRSTRVQIP